MLVAESFSSSMSTHSSVLLHSWSEACSIILSSFSSSQAMLLNQAFALLGLVLYKLVVL